jgi:steroid delta-isomerase
MPSVNSYKAGAPQRNAFTLTPNQVFIASDGAAFKWTAQLTTKDAQSVSVEGIDVVQVNEDGKIQTRHAYWDPAPVLAVRRG